MSSNLNSLQGGSEQSFVLTQSQRNRLQLAVVSNSSNPKSNPRIERVIDNALTPGTSWVPFSDDDRSATEYSLADVQGSGRSDTRQSTRLKAQKMATNAFPSSSSSSQTPSNKPPLQTNEKSKTNKRSRNDSEDPSVARTTPTNQSKTTISSTFDPTGKKLRSLDGGELTTFSPSLLPPRINKDLSQVKPPVEPSKSDSPGWFGSSFAKPGFPKPPALKLSEANPTVMDSRIARHESLWEELLTAMSDSESQSDLKHKVDEFLISTREVMEQHPDKKELRVNLRVLDEFVLDNPNTFEDASTNKPINEYTVEIGLLRWLVDPTAMGKKIEASEKIRKAFHENLESLDLSHLSLSGQMDFLFFLPNLRKLDLSWNAFTEFPLRRMQDLITLDLNNNHITQFPESIYLKSLQSLNLSRNELKELPLEFLGTLTNLKKLNLAFNQIKRLPESLGNLKKLFILILDENDLEELPGSMQSLTGLEVLTLENNRNFRKLSMSMFNALMWLTDLSVDGTKISPVVSSFILDDAKVRRTQHYLADFTERLREWKQEANSELDLSGLELFTDGEKTKISEFLSFLGRTKVFESRSTQMAELVCSKLYDALHDQKHWERFLTLIDRALVKRHDEASYLYDWYDHLNQILPPVEDLDDL